MLITNQNKEERLNALIEEIEEKSRTRSLSDEYLKDNDCSTRDEIGIGEYAYGIVMIPENWILPFLKELKEIWKKK